MANLDAPQGLQPIRHRNGAPYSGSGSLYHVPASNASAIAPGDPVTVTGTSDTRGIPDVALSTAGAGNAITGAVIGITNGEGVLLRDSALTLAASTEGYLLVEDDPDVVFQAQATTIAVTDVSSNANLQSGTASIGRSGWEVDGTSYGTGNTLQVKVLRVVREESNEVGDNAKVEVMINNHTQAHNSTGV